MFETRDPVYQGSWGIRNLLFDWLSYYRDYFKGPTKISSDLGNKNRNNTSLSRSRRQPMPLEICRIDSVYLYTFNDLRMYTHVPHVCWGQWKFIPLELGANESSQPFRRWPRDGFSHAQTREMMVGQLNCCINETWWSQMLDSMGI